MTHSTPVHSAPRPAQTPIAVTRSSPPSRSSAAPPQPSRKGCLGGCGLFVVLLLLGGGLLAAAGTAGLYLAIDQGLVQVPPQLSRYMPRQPSPHRRH